MANGSESQEYVAEDRPALLSGTGTPPLRNIVTSATYAPRCCMQHRWAHLLRELTFMVDAHDYAWAKRMKRLLLHACHQVAKRDEKTLTESEYKAVQKRYRTILTQGERELPPIPPRQKGQRGKVAKSDAHNLWERMKKYESAVLRFAMHPDVAFTNNRAERDLRMSKVKQKVSGCFRTRRYAEAYCRISSYLQSMANQGYNPLVAIQIALAGRAVDNLPE